MFKLELTQEDVTIQAESQGDGQWEGTSSDALTGKTHNFTLSSERLATILTVALCEDGNGNHPLYGVASSLVEKWPVECRPIP